MVIQFVVISLITVIIAMGMLRQEDYIIRLCLVYIVTCSPGWSSEKDSVSKEKMRELGSEDIARATEERRKVI